ncbi:MAG: polysaccharide deacetylase family protein [Sphingomonadales bacterium]
MKRRKPITVQAFSFLFLMVLALSYCKSETVKEEEIVVPANIEKPKRYIEYERSDSDRTSRIYLTFDDGPYKTTPGLTALLKKKKIRANFFIVGSQIDYSKEYDSIFKTTLQYDSFKVYNHTYTHAVTKGRIHDYYKDPTPVWTDILNNKKFLPDYPFITRLPGKNTWRTPGKTTLADLETKKLIDLLDSTNNSEQIIGWDVEWNSKTNRSIDEVTTLINKVERTLEKRNETNKDVVILLHDYLFKTQAELNLLETFIDHFSNRSDIKFDWAHNLPGVGKLQQ